MTEENEAALRGARIIRGENVTIEQYPYQVSIMKYGRHNCGGAIISKHYILTAGHCFKENTHYMIRAGNSIKDKGGRFHLVKKIIRHPQYVIDSKNLPHNDIALARVEPFEFDSTKQPIELYRAGEPSPVGTIAVITGWGKTENGETTYLRAATVPIIDSNLCDTAYQKITGGIASNQMCAGYFRIPNGQDSCQGDSGGPFAIKGRLAGIVSWGFGCANPNYPGVYTEIAKYRDWIDQNIQE